LEFIGTVFRNSNATKFMMIMMTKNDDDDVGDVIPYTISSNGSRVRRSCPSKYSTSDITSVLRFTSIVLSPS
jgi:hypothetical protein